MKREEIVAIIERILVEEFNEDGYCGLDDFDFGDFEFKRVDSLETISDGKYETGGTVFQLYKINGKQALDIFYLLPWSRTGSYYTDWDYYMEQPYLVSKKTKTIEYWG